MESVPDEKHLLTAALEAARVRAGEVDRSGEWPQPDMDALAAAGAGHWAVPTELGGDGLTPLELYERYERVAASSLTLALILSQRDSAAALIDAADGFAARPLVLRALLANSAFTTVGIAQLTTSRQGGTPALRTARSSGSPPGWQIDGFIPWSTGAARAAFVVAGAATEHGDQILFLLPTGLATGDAALDTLLGPGEGVTIDPPLPLVALRSSWTGRMSCQGVLIPDALVLRGPQPKVLCQRKNALPLGQAFLAMGLCRGGLDLIASHRSRSAQTAGQRLGEQLSSVRKEILQLSQPGREADAAVQSPRLRGACNDLAVRITHAAVAIYKGTALLDTHPAQRLAREAMFLLVWSCPDPVIDCTVDILTGAC